MIAITTMQKCIGATVAWPLLWVIVFDRWFFLSPLGLFIAFGIPIAGWVLWWKYYEGNGEKLLSEGRLILDKSSETLHKLKERFSNQS